MTNLTEKWKKGELPEGFYWIEFQDGEITSTMFSNLHGFICCDSWCDNEKIKQILAEMPIYEEYQKLLSNQLAKNEGVEINAELEKEKTKLKELLKRVVKMTAIYEDTKAAANCDCFGYYKLIKQIKQVLGEE